MTIRIAIIATCASALVLAQAGFARANYGTASALAATTGRFAHEIKKVQVAEAALVILGAGAIAGEAKKRPKGSGGAVQIYDNQNPRPVDRKSARKENGKTKAKGIAVPTDSRDVTKARGTIGYRDESTGQPGFGLRKRNQPGNTRSNVSVGGTFVSGGATQRK